MKFNRNNFRKISFLSGTASSHFGDGLQIVALSLFLLDLTGSPLAIGLMIAVYYLPILFLSPVAGVLADRHNAKVIAIGMELIWAILVLLMALAVYWNHAYLLPALAVLQATLAIAHLFFKPASQKVVREAFLPQDSVKMLSCGATSGLIASIVGSGIAGWLIVTYSPISCFVFNAATYLISAICYGALAHKKSATTAAVSAGCSPHIGEAYRLIRKETHLLYPILFAMVGSASYRLVVTLLAPFTAQSLHGDQSLYTILNVIFMVGGAAAGLLVFRLLKRFGSHISLLSFAGIALFALLVGAAHVNWLVVIGLFGLGFSTILNIASMGSLLVIGAPKAMLGRIVSLRTVVAALTKIVTAVSAGFAAEITDPQMVFFGFGLLVLLALIGAARLQKLEIPKTLTSGA